MQNVFRMLHRTHVAELDWSETEESDWGGQIRGERQPWQRRGKVLGRRRSKTEPARWRKCSGEGEIRSEIGQPERKYWKLRKESKRGRMDHSAGEEEIHSGREIASVLQIRGEIATAEGQDRDFNTNPKGTESTALSHNKKHHYYFQQPLREHEKKQRVSAASHGTL